MGYNRRGHIMKNHLLLFILACSFFGCGGENTASFDGVWNGSYTSNQNNCPFSVKADINPLFPMTVTTDVNDVFTVVAVDGSIATGGQGAGEIISFIASAPTFGNYGSIAPYSCASTLSTVGFLDAGTDKARVTLLVQFTDCYTPGSSEDPISCSVTYYGDATKVS
jgi:hypothetical protein